MEELMSGEVARLLSVHPDTVARWAKSGRLSCRVNTNGFMMFKTRDVEAFQKEREVRDEKVPA